MAIRRDRPLYIPPVGMKGTVPKEFIEFVKSDMERRKKAGIRKKPKKKK